MTNSEARKRHQAAQAPVSRPNAPNRGVDTSETANGPQIANLRRDAQVVREHIPSGYHVAHRVADAVPLLLDEIARLRAALDEARAERDTHREAAESMTGLWEQEKDRANHLEGMADRLADRRANHEPWHCCCAEGSHAGQAAALNRMKARTAAAESALEAVQALVGSVGPRSATAGSPYSTGRWDAFAEVRAALDAETEDGVFGDPEIHARLTRAALATPTTPENGDPE